MPSWSFLCCFLALRAGSCTTVWDSQDLSPVLEEMSSEIERQGRAHSSAPLCCAGGKTLLWWAQGHEVRLNSKEDIDYLLIIY